jgi:hypothetical protein
MGGPRKGLVCTAIVIPVQHCESLSLRPRVHPIAVEDPVRGLGVAARDAVDEPERCKATLGLGLRPRAPLALMGGHADALSPPPSPPGSACAPSSCAPARRRGLSEALRELEACSDDPRMFVFPITHGGGQIATLPIV